MCNQEQLCTVLRERTQVALLGQERIDAVWRLEREAARSAGRRVGHPAHALAEGASPHRRCGAIEPALGSGCNACTEGTRAEMVAHSALMKPSGRQASFALIGEYLRGATTESRYERDDGWHVRMRMIVEAGNFPLLRIGAEGSSAAPLARAGCSRRIAVRGAI